MQGMQTLNFSFLEKTTSTRMKDSSVQSVLSSSGTLRSFKISSHHAQELYHCLKCNSVSCSEWSFYNHQETHSSETYNCPVEDCGQFFRLKTSLTNHMQKHLEDHMHCSICHKEFQYRQSSLEHEKYCHRLTRTVPCPSCKKTVLDTHVYALPQIQVSYSCIGNVS